MIAIEWSPVPPLHSSPLHFTVGASLLAMPLLSLHSKSEKHREQARSYARLT
jgi:hypothetical protein